MLVVIGVPLFVFLMVKSKVVCTFDAFDRPELIEVRAHLWPRGDSAPRWCRVHCCLFCLFRCFSRLYRPSLVRSSIIHML